MRLFLFAIGGTGARVVRSLTMMLASGIEGLDSSTEIVPVIIDYDLSNADKTRAVSALEKYSQIHSSLYPDAVGQGVNYSDNFFMTKLTPLRNAGIAGAQNLQAEYELFFGPAGTAIKFTDYLGLSSMQAKPNEKVTLDLLNALYDDSDQNDRNAELNLELTLGFKGKPNIGSVVFHELRSTPELQKFFATYNAVNGDRVFIVSSIFGGTGSSGFPEIVNAIRTHQNPNVRDAIIGATVVLPYFGLGIPDPTTGDTGAVDAGSFASKSVAALTYYHNSLNNKINSLYYVGDENIDAYDYSEGSTRQENRAHVVEFVAATSIIDFMKRNVGTNDHHAFEYGIKDERKGGAIKLEDFYDGSKTAYLDNLSEFTLAVKYYRDVVCGDRNRVKTSTAFYSPNAFAQAGKLGRGVFKLFDDFIDVDYNNGQKGHWGFYPWLDEMLNHDHKLHLYNIDKSLKINDILAHKVVRGGMFSSPATSDDNITSCMNEKSHQLPAYDDKAFFKALREVAREIYNKVK